MKRCSICHGNIESDEPAVLTMSGFGNPRYICSLCEKDLDDATVSREPMEISSAIERIGEKIKNANNDDELVLETVSSIIESATERGEMIKNGVYDFENDEDDDVPDTVPEELLETEEDKEITRREEESQAKTDKIMNWVTLGLFIGAIGFIAYWVITNFF